MTLPRGAALVIVALAGGFGGGCVSDAAVRLASCLETTAADLQASNEATAMGRCDLRLAKAGRAVELVELRSD